MLLAPPGSFGYYVAADDTPSNPYGVAVTGSGTANTMGSWVSILGTISYDLFWLFVTFTDTNTSATSEQVLADLGIGPDSANVTNIADFLLAGSAANITQPERPRTYFAPLFVPAGTQLWARCQSNIASNVLDVNVQGWGGPDRPASFPVIHKWEAEGEAAGSSVGTTIVPGASGAQGTYTQMVASSAFDYVGAMMAHACEDTTMTLTSQTGGIGIGAATEQDLGTCYFAVHTTNERIGSESIPVFADIPAATRLAARMSSDIASVDTTQSAIIYGLRA